MNNLFGSDATQQAPRVDRPPLSSAPPPQAPCLPLRGSVGKMRTAIAGAAMLRKAIHISFVTNRLQGWRISILLLLTGGESSSRPCESS
jgi:hypothetical protein